MAGHPNVTFRLAPDRRDLIESAATASELSLSDFIRRAALTAAYEVLRDARAEIDAETIERIHEADVRAHCHE